MIEEYKFGAIIIDGETYDYDIMALWTGEVLEWTREDSHIVDIDDILDSLELNPETIVIGTGESGMVKVTKEAQEKIKARGIELIIDKTEQATKTFNIRKEDSFEEEGKQEKVIGLFHLTC
ncbi:MAG: MTH938/NDUFAF3 family protein [Candidatus Nealsonbacteria bacterium]|nr:MTH938/NDUFAF3 family protein [Candidatus Nealsonbacteria bacterium]